MIAGPSSPRRFSRVTLVPPSVLKARSVTLRGLAPLPLPAPVRFTVERPSRDGPPPRPRPGSAPRRRLGRRPRLGRPRSSSLRDLVGDRRGQLPGLDPVLQVVGQVQQGQGPGDRAPGRRAGARRAGGRTSRGGRSGRGTPGPARSAAGPRGGSSPRAGPPGSRPGSTVPLASMHISDRPGRPGPRPASAARPRR